MVRSGPRRARTSAQGAPVGWRRLDRPSMPLPLQTIDGHWDSRVGDDGAAAIARLLAKMRHEAGKRWRCRNATWAARRWQQDQGW